MTRPNNDLVVENESPSFEGESIDMVRLKLQTGGYNTVWTNEARKWLAQEDERSRVLNSRSQREQYITARIAKNAAIVAAIAAVAAIPLAIIGIIIAYLAYSRTL